MVLRASIGWTGEVVQRTVQLQEEPFLTFVSSRDIVFLIVAIDDTDAVIKEPRIAAVHSLKGPVAYEVVVQRQNGICCRVELPEHILVPIADEGCRASTFGRAAQGFVVEAEMDILIEFITGGIEIPPALWLHGQETPHNVMEVRHNLFKVCPLARATVMIRKKSPQIGIFVAVIGLGEGGMLEQVIRKELAHRWEFVLARS